MSEKLLNIKEVAALLSLGIKRTARILREYKVPYIDFGCGRGNGKRWLYSSIENLMLTMQKECMERSAIENRTIPLPRKTIFPDKSTKGILSVLYAKTPLQ